MGKKRKGKKKSDKQLTRDEAAQLLIELGKQYALLDAQEAALTAKLKAKIEELRQQGYYVDESEWLTDRK